MQIIPRQHGKGLKQHTTHPVTGTVIVPGQMPKTKPLSLPMNKGDVLFMHKEIPHRSLPNRSNGVRWSMDLRYQKTGTPTGRPFHPAIIVRSRNDPDSVQDSYSEWDRRWAQALANSANIKQHRWQVSENA